MNHAVLAASHIYVTSHHYAGLLKQSLGEQADQLHLLPDQDAIHLCNLPNFPKSFRNLGFATATELHTHVHRHSKQPYCPTFVLINGIGTGLGDNYVGLGILQRLQKLLAPMQAQFCMMQELEERIAPVYQHERSVSMRACFMPMDDFLQYDFFIDYSSVNDMPSFDDTAAAHFNSHALSVNKLLPDTDLQAKLTIDRNQTQHFQNLIKKALPTRRPTVLLHPLASTSLRVLPTTKAAELVKALGAAGYNVVSAFAHNKPPTHFVSMAEYCNTIDDLTHIIDAVDAVISVGTVVYHLASALGKPTLLLPTVQADIRSAQLLPEVLTWAPKANQSLYMNLHKSENAEDLAVAEKIWHNVHGTEVVSALRAHIQSFVPNARGKTVAHNKQARVGVVIPHTAQSPQLPLCVNALCQVTGFDPAHLYTISSQGLGTQHHRYTDTFNQGIQQAINNDCDFVWLLHENTQMPDHYLQSLLNHFQHCESLGIITAADKGTSSLYGRAYFKPDFLRPGQQTDLGLRQPWTHFASTLIRTEVFNTLGNLDPSMQRLFCDIDFCIRAARHGWQTWCDPTVSATFNGAPTSQPQAISELKHSASTFQQKWAKQLDTPNPLHIEEALLNHIGFV